MHEMQLMARVVSMAVEQLSAYPGARPTRIRLRVSPLSHLCSHDTAAATLAFSIAALGTSVEGASLEMTPTAGRIRCLTCRTEGMATDAALSCPACGAQGVMLEDAPELVLEAIVVEERGSMEGEDVRRLEGFDGSQI